MKSLTIISIKIALLLSVLSTSIHANPSGQSIQKLIWFNYTHTNTPLSGFVYPKGGFAQFYTKNSYSNIKKQTITKKYFNLYDGYSQFWNLMTIICEPTIFQNICINVDFEHNINQLTSKQGNFGSLILDELSLKNIKFFNRNQVKQISQYVIIVLVIIYVAWQFFTLPQLKLINQNFYLQNLAASCYLILQGSQYVKSAIQNWSNQSWKIWIFIPLILLTYKVLEDFVFKIITGKINIKTLLMIISLNLNIYFWARQTFLFPVISSFFIFCCNLQQKVQVSTQISKVQQKKIQKCGIVFMIINIKLLFKKQSCYLITILPQYFIVSFMIMFTILLSYLFKKQIIKKRQQYQENKLRIKIFVQKEHLQKQIAKFKNNQILNQQCAICYEKIQYNWAKTPCNHYFHDFCLSKWLQKSQTCPIDRKRILSNQHQQMKQSQHLMIEQ